MDFASEEQLNKLIRAYNEEQIEPTIDDTMGKSCLQIDEFEEKLKVNKSSTVKTQKLKREPVSVEYDMIKIPELPEHMRQEIHVNKEEKLYDEIEELEEVKEEEIDEIKEEKEEKEESGKEIEQVVYMTDDKLVDKKLRELVYKNRDISLALQKAQSENIQLKEKERKATEKADKYKRLAELAKNTDLQSQIDQEKARVRSLEEDKASLRLRIDAMERETGRVMKILKREVGEEIDLRELEKDESAWVGRAQQIELLKGKLKAKKRRPEISLREERKSLLNGPDRAEELFKLKKEMAEVVC